MNFKQKNLRVLSAAVLGASAMLGTVAANATGAAVDVSDTVATVGAQLVPIGLVGIAVLGVFVAVKAFKWVRGALS